MSASIKYQHSKLPSLSSIRLVKLLAGPLNDKLQCEIDVVTIEDDLDYEAISYVWGTSENKPAIQVCSEYGNSALEIPANLGAALRRFRHGSSTRTLWIDSICINQNDDDERSHQVQLMGKIYRSASTVLIWLGEDPKEGKTAQACTCMNLLNSASPRVNALQDNKLEGLPESTTEVDSFLGITRRSSDDVHGELGIPLLGSSQFDALMELLKNSWFSRAWTWQESFLARKRVFHCSSWSWSTVLLTEVYLVLRGLSQICGNKSYLPDEHRDVLAMISGLEFWTRREQSPKYYLELFALLSLRRGADCKYPSDLLYSLLGAAWQVPNIQVDYKLPFEVVFAKSTWQIMVQRGNLSILSEIEKDRLPSALPTWVPDWRVRRETTGIHPVLQRIVPYGATGSSRPIVRLSDDAEVLTASGLHWDQISAIKSANSADIDEWINGMFDTTLDDKKYYNVTHESLERALRRVFYLDLTEFTSENEITRWKPDSHEHFEDIVQKALSDGQRGRLRYGVLLHSMIRMRRSRTVIVTASGRLGMASDNVRTGDVITMLLGGEVPIVLRPLNESGHYTFVAECYIHGFMDGESLIETRKSAQPEYDPADVSWLKEPDLGNVPVPIEEFHIH